jgi:hypothetical protein
MYSTVEKIVGNGLERRFKVCENRYLGYFEPFRGRAA